MEGEICRLEIAAGLNLVLPVLVRDGLAARAAALRLKDAVTITGSLHSLIWKTREGKEKTTYVLEAETIEPHA